MSAGFHVEPGTLTAAATRMDGVAAAVSAALSELSGALGGTGGMAGNDRVGQKFTSEYDPAAGGLTAGMHGLADGLGTVAAALRATAANYGGSDAHSVMHSN